MASVLGFLGVNFVMFLRFFLPRALYEPKTNFTIGYPSDFGFGVDTKFQNQYRIWVVRNTEGIFVISAICTHLGCTPDWKASENKFKCPCHGSGYDPEGVNFVMFLRFFLPRALYEPKTNFTIGYPSDFGFGVDTKFQNQYRIWVVRNTEGIFVISAICTHLGCTPDWKASENKFKCPCHGSGYDPEGVNFEGPAPRPMDRAHVELDPEGRIVVDLSRLYRWPKGERSQFNDPGAIIRV
jgi:cytochrome b6-f complex iron-sulfur subunit